MFRARRAPYNTAERNLIVANYGADGGCLDNDDGSSYYAISSNVCFYGGHKSDFDGHDKVSRGNLHVHPSVYGGKCVGERSHPLVRGVSQPVEA